MLDELQVQFTLSQGRILRSFGKDYELTLGPVKCVFRQLLEGLDYLHKNDIIHRYALSFFGLHGLKFDRDVKMQNILLNAKGVVKLGE